VVLGTYVRETARQKGEGVRRKGVGQPCDRCHGVRQQRQWRRVPEALELSQGFEPLRPRFGEYGRSAHEPLPDPAMVLPFRAAADLHRYLADSGEFDCDGDAMPNLICTSQTAHRASVKGVFTLPHRRTACCMVSCGKPPKHCRAKPDTWQTTLRWSYPCPNLRVQLISVLLSSRLFSEDCHRHE